MGPTQLAEVLRQIPPSHNPDLLVGLQTRDDAGVFRVSPDLALVQTVDILTPIVDDPFIYGQIAAANSLSDVYAMGGKPLTALIIACFPGDENPEVWAEVFRGISAKVADANVVILGGHSIKDSEPKFGLSVTGTVRPDELFANSFAKPGDHIYLSKPIGTGVVSTAAKRGGCSAETLAAVSDSMTILNREAAEVGRAQGVRCATDITGFGLAGHLFNVAEASKVGIEIAHDAIPLHPDVESLIENGFVTGGAANTETYLGANLEITPGLPSWVTAVVCDPQTSGGLALFSPKDLPYPKIGTVSGPPGKISVV